MVSLVGCSVAQGLLFEKDTFSGGKAPREGKYYFLGPNSGPDAVPELFVSFQ